MTIVWTLEESKPQVCLPFSRELYVDSSYLKLNNFEQGKYGYTADNEILVGTA
jgi:hypothetical protein